MPQVKTFADRIYYAERGNDPGRSHAPLLFIHGAGDTHLIWNGQLAAFSTTARTLALDLPAHGRSIGTVRTTIAEFAAVVRDFLDALNIPRAIIVGISMGGAIAQTLALEFPDRVLALALVSTGAKLRVAPQFLNGIRTAFETTAPLIVQYYYAAGASPALQAASLAQLRKTGSAVAYADYAACDAFDVRARLASISAPTLVICGRDDLLTPLKYSEYLSQQIPHAQLVILEHAAHLVMLEQPTAFNAALTSWLARIRSG